jgi:hypothetical protein
MKMYVLIILTFIFIVLLMFLDHPLFVVCNFDYRSPNIEVEVDTSSGGEIMTRRIGACYAHYYNNSGRVD